MNSNPLHGSYNEVAMLIERGQSDRGISMALKVDRRTVRKIRRMLGVAPYVVATDVDARLAEHCTEPDENGHVMWTGALTSGGIPRLRCGNREMSASHLVYLRRTGREPVGIVKADCGVRGCLAPTHVVDEIERRTIRLMMRNVNGRPAPWAVCEHCGGDWDRHGRVDEKENLYCVTCRTAAAKRNREARKESA